MKRSELKLRPATVAEARAILGLENQPTLAAQVRRSLRRQRKAKNRAAFRRRQRLRKLVGRSPKRSMPLFTVTVITAPTIRGEIPVTFCFYDE